MKKILITGSTGFIGKRLVNNLVNNNNNQIFSIIRKTGRNYKYSLKIKKKT